MPNLKYLAGIYLVDIYCLGVKDAFVKSRLKDEDLRALLSRVSNKLQEIPYEEARSVVLGAVEYAGKIGFEPQRDYEMASKIIESEREYQRKFTFGKNGKPFYIQGPHDDPLEIMSKLAPLLKDGQAHFISRAEQFGFDDLEELTFEERCEDIADLIEEGLFEEARGETQELIGEFPARSEPLFLMGTCLAVEGKVSESALYLERSIDISPSSEAYTNLAGVYTQLLLFKGAVTCLKKVIQLDGKQGQFGKQAKADLETLTTLIKEETGLMLEEYLENKKCFERAFENLKTGHYEEAIQGFNQVLEKQPDHVQTFGNLGLAFAGLGDRENALRSFDRAIALDPEYQPAIDNRLLVLNLAFGEKLNSNSMCEVEFYTEKARAAQREEKQMQSTGNPGLTRNQLDTSIAKSQKCRS